MRYLKPKGTLLKVGDKEYLLKFTLDVIDEIQTATNLPLPEIMNMTLKRKYRKNAIKVLLKYLTGDEIEVPDNELDYYSEMLIMTYINQVRSKPYEGEKKPESGDECEFLNVERFLYLATVVLGRPTEEAWQMTIGQINTLNKEHQLYIGAIKKEEEVDIMDIG